jgi:hypothetical protein
LRFETEDLISRKNAQLLADEKKKQKLRFKPLDGQPAVGDDVSSFR